MIRGRKVSAAAAAGALSIVTILAAGGSPAAAQAAGTATAAADESITHEENPRVPEGAAWTEAYFPSSDGSG
ncbi:hypothetical protein, partial [Micromonospora avicenniae]